MNRTEQIETVMAVSGILGAAMVASAWHMGAGFAAFLVSNIAGLVFAARCRHWRMFTQQAAFLATSLVGLRTWWPVAG